LSLPRYDEVVGMLTRAVLLLLAAFAVGVAVGFVLARMTA
jgi:hypothetical protein